MGPQSLKLKSSSLFSEASISLSMAGKHSPRTVTPKRPNSFTIPAGKLTVNRVDSKTPYDANSTYGYVLIRKYTSTPSASVAAGKAEDGQLYFDFNSKSNQATYKSVEAYTINIRKFSVNNLETAKVWFRLGSTSFFATVSLAELATNREAELRFSE